MTWGAVPVRTVEVSSANVTSRTQWVQFSIDQWPRVGAQDGGGSGAGGHAGDAVGDLSLRVRWPSSPPVSRRTRKTLCGVWPVDGVTVIR